MGSGSWDPDTSRSSSAADQFEGTLKPVDIAGVEEWAKRNDENGEGIHAIVYALQQVMESREVTYLFEDRVPVPTARFPSLKDKRAMTVLFNDRETHLQIASLEEFVAANGIDNYVLEALDLEQLRNRMTGRVRRYVGNEATEKIEAERADTRPRVSITIERQANDSEQLAAPVAAADIARALKAEGHEVGAGNLQLDGPIEKLGLYKVTARLDPETELKVSV